MKKSQNLFRLNATGVVHYHGSTISSYLFLCRVGFFYRTNLNYLILNLAVADMMYAIFIAPKFFVKLAGSHPDGVTGLVLCKLLTDGTIAWIGGASSIVTLVAIALERYYAVLYPLGNKGKLTKRKLKVWYFYF